MVISEKNRNLMTRVLDTINWDLIYKFYKLVDRKIGTETNQIPGIKKLEKGAKLAKENIREEVECLILYAMENDISNFVYGPWEITWVNGEWEVEIDPENNENSDNEDGEDKYFLPIGESLLEIHFSPLVVSAKEMVIEESEEDESTEKNKRITRKDLEKELEAAVSEENYELASRLRDLISIYKNNRQKK